MAPRGAAFDIEGGVNTADMLVWIERMKERHPSWTFVHVPDTAEPPLEWDPLSGPDFVAPMMYYSNYNSYPKMHMQDGGEAAYVLKQLHQAGWPSSRIILTYHPFDAARLRSAGNNTLLPLLLRLLGNFSVDVSVYGEPFRFQGPYAGVLGWPAQCGLGDRRDGRCWPEADQSNLLQIVEAARQAGVTGLGKLWSGLDWKRF